MFFSLWSVLLCFVGLNPAGMFLSLWALTIPARALACLGLYHGIRTILLREPRKTLAIIGTRGHQRPAVRNLCTRLAAFAEMLL